MALARRYEIGKHPSGVGVHDGHLAVGVVANKGRDHDIEGAAAIEPF
jgi:hypothetical protein